MRSVGDLIKNKVINVNNDNISSSNNVNGNVKKKSYALNKEKFIPNTEETQLAEEIADYFDDIENYACFLYYINKKGCAEIRRAYRSTVSDIEEKKNTKFPVRNPVKYFIWKIKREMY